MCKYPLVEIWYKVGVPWSFEGALDFSFNFDLDNTRLCSLEYWLILLKFMTNLLFLKVRLISEGALDFDD